MKEGTRQRKGHPKPPGVKAHVLRLAGLNPRPTNRAIIEDVYRKFGVAISERTIVRYCDDAGVPRSTSTSKRAGAQQAAADAPVEQLLRWHREVRRTADDFSLRAILERHADPPDDVLRNLLAAARPEEQAPEPAVRRWYEETIAHQGQAPGGGGRLVLPIEREGILAMLRQRLDRPALFQQYETWGITLVSYLEQVRSWYLRVAVVAAAWTVARYRSGAMGAGPPASRPEHMEVMTQGWRALAHTMAYDLLMEELRQREPDPGLLGVAVELKQCRDASAAQLMGELAAYRHRLINEGLLRDLDPAPPIIEEILDTRSQLWDRYQGVQQATTTLLDAITASLRRRPSSAPQQPG